MHSGEVTRNGTSTEIGMEKNTARGGGGGLRRASRLKVTEGHGSKWTTDKVNRRMINELNVEISFHGKLNRLNKPVDHACCARLTQPTPHLTKSIPRGPLLMTIATLVALFRDKRLYMKTTDSDATIFENGMLITSDKDFFQRASAGTGG